MVLFRLCVVLLLVLVSRVAGAFGPSSKVKDVDDKSFSKSVLKNEGIVIVEFYAPWCGHCKSLAPEMEKAAALLQGVVTVAAVDATQSEALAQKYQIQGFPTIKVFGADKKAPVDYQGQRTADAIVTEGMKAVRRLVSDRQSGKAKKEKGSSGSRRPSPAPRGGGKKRDVVTVTADNFDTEVLGSDEAVFVEFYAPWCGHCKSLEPEWAQAATELKDSGVKLCAVDATQHENLARRYGVSGYPTIKVFPPGPKSAEPTPYNGPRDSSGIVAFALNLMETSDWEPGVPELTETQQLSQKCQGNKICVIAALPHILDSGKEGREDYIATLVSAAKKAKAAHFLLMWTEGGVQGEFEEAMGLTFGYPAVVAYSKEKGARAVHVGSFNTEAVGNFLKGLMTGSTKTIPLATVPRILSVTPWDGEAPVLEEEEEPFSLEDFLNEDL